MGETTLDRRNKVISACELFIKRKEYNKALALLNNEISVNPEDKHILYHIGFVYRAINDLDNAETFYLKALASHGESLLPNAAICCQLGIIYQIKEEYKKAIEMFEKSITLNNLLATAYNSLAITYKKMGNYVKAVEVYDRGIEVLVNAASDEAIKKRDKCFKDKMTDEGKKVLEVQHYYMEKVAETLKCNGDYAMLLYNKSRIYAEVGRIDEAKQMLEESKEFIPDEEAEYRKELLL